MPPQATSWHSIPEARTRRDFLYLAAGSAASAGAALSLWPLVDSLNPSADVVAASYVFVDLSRIAPGERVTVLWQQHKTIFISHRTDDEIAAARAGDRARLLDPEPDGQRVRRPEWLLVYGWCTLPKGGCVLLGQQTDQPRGKWSGWMCPCCGANFDTSGRVRSYPAPRNLSIPPYAFENDRLIRIG